MIFSPKVFRLGIPHVHPESFIDELEFWMNSDLLNCSRTFGSAMSPLPINSCSNSKGCQAEFALKKQVCRTNIQLLYSPGPMLVGLQTPLPEVCSSGRRRSVKYPHAASLWSQLTVARAGEKCIKPSLSLTVPEMAHLAPNGRSGMHYLLEENYLLWEY